MITKVRKLGDAEFKDIDHPDDAGMVCYGMRYQTWRGDVITIGPLTA